MSYKFSTTCLKCSLLGLFLLILQAGWSQYNWSELDKQLTDKQQVLGNNVAVLIWRGDSLVFKKEMGGFTSKTVVPIASCSKWLTAALVLKMVDEGKLSLDDKVAKYLPIFESYNKNYITIRHCLSHYTGIKDQTTVGKILGGDRYKSLEDEVNAYAAREIRVNAGEDFSYGSVGLNIAARVVEVISKKKFEILIKQKLFSPLEMRKTSFASPDFSSSINPSGGAVSTADDYMNFLVMLLNKGKYKGQQILSEKSIDEMMKLHSKPEQMKSVPKAATGFGYALGSWVIEQNNGKGTVLACPGLFGSWPMIDYCRGYAYLAFTKSLLGEAKADAQLAIRQTIDKQLPSTCK